MDSRMLEDPRVDPRIKAMFGKVPGTRLPDVASREELLAMVAAAEKPPVEMGGLTHAAYEGVAPSAGLSIQRQAIVSQPDGNVINLQIIAPEVGEGPWPCVYYIHGGGMMLGSCFDPIHSAWGRLVAAQGVVVVQVDFRNCVTPSSVPEIAPFPAGLNDCVSGLRWVHANAAALNVDPARVVINGESGGGNLTLAVALKLEREGDLGIVSGLYAMCPYLAGEWADAEGSSVSRNAGILMDARSNYGAMAYGIGELETRNPLAWPAYAREADVVGFPPTIIAVNECDPLMDDGVAFYRLLLRAGVPARAKIVMGTVHATEVSCLTCPDVSRDAARELAALARGG
jgi:acetyl esterase/lipase